MCNVRDFSLVFEFVFRCQFLLKRVSFLFGQHKTKTTTNNNTESGGQSPPATTMKIQHKTQNTESRNVQNWPPEFKKLRVGIVTGPYKYGGWNFTFCELSRGLGKPVAQNVIS